MSITTLLILACIGVFAGIVSGMIGIGGGLIIVPSLLYLLGVNQFGAQGTSIAAMLPPIGILAAYNYHRADAVNWKYALIISATFIIGGYLGSKLTINFISESALKKIFGVLMLIGAIKMIFFSK
ncbi:MAG: sulfite exporter TauE/SafE family protein [Flavobacteriales bacterium]|nr:sulfite exporter TauE/SafE family protein [Flavobacteriales bacterium]